MKVEGYKQRTTKQRATAAEPISAELGPATVAFPCRQAGQVSRLSSKRKATDKAVLFGGAWHRVLTAGAGEWGGRGELPSHPLTP